jgi:hypothetical protein
MVAVPPAPSGALLFPFWGETIVLTAISRNWPGQGQIVATEVLRHFRPDSHASAEQSHQCEQAMLAKARTKWRHVADAPKGMTMRAFALALLLMIAASHAFAQSMPMGTGIPLNQEKEVTPEQRLKRQQTEEAYKSTIKNIPDAKPVDPWGNMRSTDTGTAAKSKAAPKKTN